MTIENRTGIPRWIDAAAAMSALVVLTPVFVALALGVRLSSSGPVLFRQVRVGRGGKSFTMLKFRTMRVGGRGPQITTAGDDRITRFGGVLRKTKLDELPELWNVLRGDMSIVGPRPEVPSYVDLRDPAWREVLRSRPGITDPVTVSLRSEEDVLASAGGDWESFYRSVLLPYKLEGYLNYLRGRTLGSDLRVLCRTIVAICAPGTVPTPDPVQRRREASANES